MSLATYGCVVPVSIGNKAIAKPEPKINVKSNTVYSQNGKTMIALNYILPHKAVSRDVNKDSNHACIKREDLSVYNSLKFLVPEEQNDDGNLTYMFTDIILKIKLRYF